MSRWIKYIVGILIVAFLLWYLSRHWERLRPLLKLNSIELLLIYIVTLFSCFNAAYVMKRLLKILKINASFWDMLMLQNAGYLLNYLPMKFGTLFRAAYLKHHYELMYAHFGVFFVYLGLLMALTASFVGLIVLAVVYSFSGYEAEILTAAFLCVFIVSLLFAFVPLPLPKGTNKFSANLRNFINGRQEFIRNKGELIICTGFLVLSYVIASVRLGIIYHSMEQDIHPAGYLVLGSLAYVTMFVNITPGALGLRELVLGSGAIALGVPLEVGILAAVIDRAIALSWSFVIGGGCTIRLWQKYPEDFKSAGKGQITEQVRGEGLL